MNKSGPIIIIEDDRGDQELLSLALSDLGFENEVIFFEDGETVFEYLNITEIEPFLILSDINMPRLNGLELRERIHTNENLRLKCIPYLFFTTSGEQKFVVDAYSKSVQGFFIKPDNYEDLVRVIKLILDYWYECESPNYLK